ncbi:MULTISPECIES: hypothetical protein [Nostocales]|uniref:Uncharacterized protein n=1 Tax=Nostoc spongiaeforme FACHB-130 TaxID=1357510 RepID=A0ABR8FN16_9NOSO|nr:MULTISPECIES: hypothetical protein [Nostocales]MBD2489427.1 hypothetical protein [Aulosira sp. FACHB-615]MBD2592876.1 hypothetical protein [Nostoc spongiaeforme FACHB-130]
MLNDKKRPADICFGGETVILAGFTSVSPRQTQQNREVTLDVIAVENR